MENQFADLLEISLYVKDGAIDVYLNMYSKTHGIWSGNKNFPLPQKVGDTLRNEPWGPYGRDKDDNIIIQQYQSFSQLKGVTLANMFAIE